MTDARHIVITLADAKRIADALRGNAEMSAIVERFAVETGADMRELVHELTHLGKCQACIIEGQERDCVSIPAAKLGRRLRRLLDRADGSRA